MMQMMPSKWKMQLWDAEFDSFPAKQWVGGWVGDGGGEAGGGGWQVTTNT